MAKESWKTLNIKDKLAIVSAIAAFVIGWGLTIAGFIIEPIGDVADSVLWVLGQSLIYAASVFGVSAYFNAEAKQMRKDIKGYVNRGVKKEEILEENEE